MPENDDALFADTIKKVEDDVDLTPREKRQLKQPTTTVTPENIFKWHLDKYTVFEDETDPVEVKHGVLYRRVGVLDGGRLSESGIAGHERRLAISLPSAWRDVYRYFNGGIASGLFWGDLENPKHKDIWASPVVSPQYLALEDVAPLRQFIIASCPKLDATRIDKRLIALAFKHNEAIVLDYRYSDDPAVGSIYFNEYDDDPLSRFEKEAFWWPNMRVFFRGLYLQNRAV